jgi:hypothetical protein
MFALNRSWLMMLALTFCLVETAEADLFALFSDDGGATFSDSYVVTTGDSISIDVFLGQDGINTELTDSGLFSLGLAASTPSTTSASITNATLSPVFEFETTNQFDADSFDWESAAFSNPVPMGTEVFLGSFEVTTVANGTTTFSFADIAPGGGMIDGNWLTPDLDILDETIFGAGGTGTYELMVEAVSQVPEPSVGALFAFFCIGLVRKRNRCI